MIITCNDIYWITRLDGIHEFLTGIQILGIMCVGLAILHYMKSVALPKWIKRISVIGGIIATLCGIATTFIPTTKEMIMIKGIPALVNSEIVQDKLPKEAGEIYQLGKDYLKEKLEIKNTEVKK